MPTPPSGPDRPDDPSPLEDGQAVIEEACTLLQSWSRGDLRFDDNIVPCRFVHTSDGRLVAPVMVAALHTSDTVLMIPDEHAPVLELLLSLTPFEEDGPDGRWADRWRIYHGDEEDINWAFLDIDMGRMSSIVIDGDALTRANPLVEEEPVLCRAINELGPTVLKRMCRSRIDLEVESPLVVGVDPTGLDVRARFDVLRIPFPMAMDLPDDIIAAVRGWGAG